MATAAHRPVILRVGEFQIESLGAEWPDYLQGYGLGPQSEYSHCTYGVGDTEEQAFLDCLEMAAQQGFDIDVETEERIRAKYGPTDDSVTTLELSEVEEETDESPCFYVGIKWNCREEERLQQIRKLSVEFLQYENYCPQNPSEHHPEIWNWGYTRRIDPDDKTVSYGDLKPGNCPQNAAEYLEALSTDPQAEGEIYFYLPYATGSDYSGSTVERANCKVFLESHEEDNFVWGAHGGFNTYAVVLGLTGLLECPDDTFTAILDIIEGLERYPVIDEEALTVLEMDLANGAWDSWVAFDFRRGLENKFSEIDFEWPPDSDLRALFEKSAEKANEYWFNEGHGPDMYIRVDRIVKAIDLNDLAPYIVQGGRA